MECRNIYISTLTPSSPVQSSAGLHFAAAVISFAGVVVREAVAVVATESVAAVLELRGVAAAVAAGDIPVVAVAVDW